jgi:hypothetical protein
MPANSKRTDTKSSRSREPDTTSSQLKVPKASAGRSGSRKKSWEPKWKAVDEAAVEPEAAARKQLKSGNALEVQAESKGTSEPEAAKATDHRPETGATDQSTVKMALVEPQTGVQRIASNLLEAPKAARSAVEGQVVYFNQKVTEPIKFGALSVYAASLEKASVALQKFEPYIAKVQNGVAIVIGRIGKQVVVVQARISDVGTTIQVRTLESLNGARTFIEGYTTPLKSRVSNLRSVTAAKVDRIYVSFEDGIVHARAVVDQRVLHLQTKVSETFVYKKLSSVWQSAMETTSNLVAKVFEVVSNVYAKAITDVRLVYCRMHNGFCQIMCQVNDRLVLVKVNILEQRSVAKLARALTDVKLRINGATEAVKAKTVEAGANIRSIASNPSAQATAAGAIALGSGAGATGLVAGGAMGAVCAVPAAFFTFGLSIPVGMAVGAGSGFCVGGSIGLISGGAVGYKAHKEKAAIGDRVSGALAKAKECKEMAQGATCSLAQRVGKMGGTAFA